MTRPELTLLVPCFNEGARIDRFLQSASAWTARHPHVSVEVLCVDDGSTDDSRGRLERAARRWPWMRVLRLESNRGKGAALRAGIMQAGGEVVLFLDADLAVDLTHIGRALALIEGGADLVVGCRNIAGAVVLHRQRWPRRWMGRVYRWMARRWLRLAVADITCGFKAFRRDVGRSLLSRSAAARWGFDAEILYLAERAGHVIREMPVQWYDGETSAVRLRRDVWGALRELAAVRWRHRSTTVEAAPAPAVAPRQVPAGSIRDS